MNEPSTFTADDLVAQERRMLCLALSRSYRDHYCASIGTELQATWERLVSKGLAKRRDPGATTVTYFVTEAGHAFFREMRPRLRMQYAGAEWLARSDKREVSPLGRTVADALGLVYRGIYHLPDGLLSKVDWSDRDRIAITVPDDLCTWDGCGLTQLVIVCHDLMLRMELEGINQHYVRLVFYQRWVREGGVSERLPTIESMIKMTRAMYDVATEADHLDAAAAESVAPAITETAP